MRFAPALSSSPQARISGLFVRPCPLQMGIWTRVQPPVADRDGAGVHVVLLVRQDERDRKEVGAVARERARRRIARGGHVREVPRGVVLARVVRGTVAVLQPMYPVPAGFPSNPANEWPPTSGSPPRLGDAKCCGHVSLLTPKVEPVKSAR